MRSKWGTHREKEPGSKLNHVMIINFCHVFQAKFSLQFFEPKMSSLVSFFFRTLRCAFYLTSLFSECFFVATNLIFGTQLVVSRRKSETAAMKDEWRKEWKEQSEPFFWWCRMTWHLFAACSSFSLFSASFPCLWFCYTTQGSKWAKSLTEKRDITLFIPSRSSGSSSFRSLSGDS